MVERSKVDTELDSLNKVQLVLSLFCVCTLAFECFSTITMILEKVLFLRVYTKKKKKKKKKIGKFSKVKNEGARLTYIKCGFKNALSITLVFTIIIIFGCMVMSQCKLSWRYCVT